MISKYVETPPSSSGIFLALTALEVLANTDKGMKSSSVINEKDIYLSFVESCKDMAIKLNGKSGISGLCFDLPSLCDFLSMYNCIQSASSGLDSDTKSSFESKRIVEVVLSTLKSKWGDYVNKFVKGQRDIVMKKQTLLNSALPVESVACANLENDSIKQISIATGISKPDPESITTEKDHTIEFNYRNWVLCDNPFDQNSSKRMEMLINPKASFQEFHQTVYMEQYVLETEEYLMRRILSQLNINLMSELTGEQKPNSYIRTGTRYLLSDYRYKLPIIPKPVVVEVDLQNKNAESHPLETKQIRKEKVLPIISTKTVDVSVEKVSSCSSSHGGGLLSKSLVNGSVFTSQMLVDKARKVVKYRDNNPVDIVLLQKRYEETYDACSVYRSASAAGHTPKLLKKSKSLTTSNINLDSVASLIKKRKNHLLPPCYINMNENVQVNPSGNEYNLYAASFTNPASNVAQPIGTNIVRSSSNTSDVGKALKRSSSSGNVASNPPTMNSVNSNSSVCTIMPISHLPVHPGHILLPDLVIRTTEIPWGFIAKEFVVLDHTEELGDYGTLKRSASTVEFSSKESLNSTELSTADRNTRLKRKLSEVHEMDDMVELKDSRNDLKKHVSIVLAPKFEPIPPTLFKLYPNKDKDKKCKSPIEYSIGRVDIPSDGEDEDSEEDISDENMLAKHDAVLANMREKWVQFSSLKKSVDAVPNTAIYATPKSNVVNANKFTKKRSISKISSSSELIANSPLGTKVPLPMISVASNVLHISSGSSPSESCSPLQDNGVPKKARGRPVKFGVKLTQK